jgi:hypothetical protein
MERGSWLRADRTDCLAPCIRTAQSTSCQFLETPKPPEGCGPPSVGMPGGNAPRNSSYFAPQSAAMPALPTLKGLPIFLAGRLLWP